METGPAFQQCLATNCGAKFAIDQALFSCPVCGDLIDVVYDWYRLPVPTPLGRI